MPTQLGRLARLLACQNAVVDVVLVVVVVVVVAGGVGVGAGVMFLPSWGRQQMVDKLNMKHGLSEEHRGFLGMCSLYTQEIIWNMLFLYTGSNLEYALSIHCGFLGRGYTHTPWSSWNYHALFRHCGFL